MRLYIVDCGPGGWDVLTEALVACDTIQEAYAIVQAEVEQYQTWIDNGIRYVGEAGPHIERGIVMEAYHNG